jgi:dephospho-CoA kinase
MGQKSKRSKSMRIIGLTGNIASGKSEISKILRKLGAVIIDMDKIGKEVQSKNIDNVVEKIREAFGREFIRNGKIDRKKLGNFVFKNKEALQKLNEIMIPAMTKLLKQKLEECKEKNAEVVVIDAAILFEAGWDKYADEVWVVYTPKELQLKRLMNREKISENQALARINAQMDIYEKMKKADYIINNSGDLNMVKEQVKKLWTKTRNSI